MGNDQLESVESIASRAEGVDRFVGVAAAVLMLLHMVSVFIPAMKVTRLLFFKDTISIWNTIAQLFERGEWVIAPVLFLFTIAFPLFKLMAIIYLFAGQSISDPKLHSHLSRLESLGRWSMLDVMVAALLIVSLTATGLADARFLPGMYLFTFSVVGTLLLSRRVSILARRFGVALPG